MASEGSKPGEGAASKDATMAVSAEGASPPDSDNAKNQGQPTGCFPPPAPLESAGQNASSARRCSNADASSTFLLANVSEQYGNSIFSSSDANAGIAASSPATSVSLTTAAGSTAATGQSAPANHTSMHHFQQKPPPSKSQKSDASFSFSEGEKESHIADHALDCTKSHQLPMFLSSESYFCY